MTLAYFITFSTYGTWLHGTGKGEGSVDRHHNVYGMPFVAPDGEREQHAADRMSDSPYVLQEMARTIVRDAIVGLCIEKDWTLLALHVRTNHVHVVISADREPGRLMSDLKARASRDLNRKGAAHEVSGFSSESAKRWTRHGSTRHLFDDASVAAAVAYTLDEQGESMAVYDPRPHRPEHESAHKRAAHKRAAHEVSGLHATPTPLTSCERMTHADTDPFADAGKGVEPASGHRVLDHSVDVNKIVQHRLENAQGAAHEVSGIRNAPQDTPLTSCAAPPHTATDHFADAGKVIEPASGHQVSNHFIDVNKTIPMPPNARKLVDDVRLIPIDWKTNER